MRKHVNLMCIFFHAFRNKILVHCTDHECHGAYLMFMTSYDFKRTPKITKRDYELRHVCLHVCRSVHLSVCMEQFGCQWTDIHEC